MSKEFKEYIKQGIGIWIGFVIANIILVIGVAVLALLFTLIRGTIVAVDDAMTQARIERQVEAEDKAEKARAEARAQAGAKAEKARAEAKAKAQEERNKILINEATGEIKIEKDGTYMLEVIGGTGNISILNINGDERRRMVNAKPEQVSEYEMVTGEKIVLPSGMSVRWGIKE